MISVWSRYFLGVLLAVSCRAELTLLTSDSLRDHAQNGDSVVVTITSSQCDTCDDMLGILSKLSDEIEDVTFSQIKADLDPGVVDDLHITQYPTTLMFHKGAPQIYTQEQRDEESFRRFMDEVLSAKTVDMVSPDALRSTLQESLVEKKHVVFLMELQQADSANFETYDEAAATLKNLAAFLAYVNPKATAESIRVYRPTESVSQDDNGVHVFKSAGRLSKISPGRTLKFLQAELTAPFGGLAPPPFYLSSKIAYYAGTAEEIAAARPVLEAVGRKSRPEYNFVALVLPEQETVVRDSLGMPGPFPQLMATFDEKRFVRRYLFDGALEEDVILDFVRDADEKNYPRYFRSEEELDPSEAEPVGGVVPADCPKNVRKLVNKNLKETVRANAQHHFLTLVHTSWCEHCVAALKSFCAVAAEFLDNDHVIFATFEASKNDPPSREFSTVSYPALFHSSAASSFSIHNRLPSLTVESLRELIEQSLEGERLVLEEKLRKHFDVDDEDSDEGSDHDEESDHDENHPDRDEGVGSGEPRDEL